MAKSVVASTLTPHGTPAQMNDRHLSASDWETEGVCLLKELHHLLETYAPGWYAERLHQRAELFLTRR